MREKQKRGDAKRAEIMEIARAEFMNTGYAATSMSAIAGKVGGSKGTLYNHFRSKEELFSAIISETCNAHFDAMFGMVDDAQPVDRTLRDLGKSFLDLILSPDGMTLMRVISAEVERFPELGHILYETGPRQGTRRIGATLQAAMDRGELRPANPEAATRHFKSLCIGDLHMRHLLGVLDDVDADFIEKRVDEAVDVFMRAYGPEQR